MTTQDNEKQSLRGAGRMGLICAFCSRRAAVHVVGQFRDHHSCSECVSLHAHKEDCDKLCRHLQRQVRVALRCGVEAAQREFASASELLPDTPEQRRRAAALDAESESEWKAGVRQMEETNRQAMRDRVRGVAELCAKATGGDAGIGRGCITMPELIERLAVVVGYLVDELGERGGCDGQAKG